MVRVSSDDVDSQGATGDVDDVGDGDPVDAGRQQAVDVVQALEDGPTATADGGLSRAAWEYYRSNADVSREAARRWDLATDVHRGVDASGLPAVGPDGDVESTIDRSATNAAVHRAIREYRALEDRTG